MGQPILRTEKLCKSFSSSGEQQHVLKNLDLTIGKGDFTVIMGSSGSGKSTLLYTLSGMDKPTMGDIYFGDRYLSRLSNDQLAVFRRQYCGFVFQQIHLLDHMSVLDNVLASGLLVSKDKKALTAEAKRLLTQVGLEASSWGKFPSQMSGGETQRAAIARALINRPQIVFADEPTGALNSATSSQVLDVLTEVHNSGQSLIMVTHDLKSALRGNRVLYLRDGVICGDLALKPYGEDESSTRNEQLLAFLSEMGW